MSPFEVDQILRTAFGHYHAEQREQAVALCRRILAESPDHDGALQLLCVSAVQNNRRDLAIECLQRATVIQPNNPTYHGALGDLSMAQGSLDEAASCYRRLLELKPDFVEAHNNLGAVLFGQGKWDEAAACFRRALALKPDCAEAHNNLGDALKDQGMRDEAVTSYRRALELKPDFAEAHNNLGAALLGQGKLDEAVACYRRSLQLNPGFADARHNLGAALLGQMKLEEAEIHINEAIRLRPDHGDAHLNRSYLLLLRGDFAGGWVEREWRCKTKRHISPGHSFTQPLWDGSPLHGRTILLYSEQGFGDTLQFIRYAPLIAQFGGNVIVAYQPQLKRLLQNSLKDIHLFDCREPLPPFDVHSSLLSLPLACRTTLQTIPRQVPYVEADAESIAHWRKKIADEAGCLKVGLAWAGNKDQSNDRNRSMTLGALAPLGRVAGVRLYSLQKGEPAQQALQPPAGMQLIDWTDELADFADTAAFMANLDLIISVDTSVAHLAGAMGKPVWTLLSFAADWRYLLEREDSPWYPTMRLFRQPAPGDWPSVVERVADDLRRHARPEAAASGAPTPPRSESVSPGGGGLAGRSRPD